MPYQSNVTGALARLLQEQGQIAAQRSAETGRLWGGAVSNLGARVAGGFADAQRRREEAPRKALEAQEIAARTTALKDNEEAKATAKKVQRVSQFLGDLASAEDPQALYQQGRAALIADGTFTEQDAPAFFPGKSWVKARMTQLLPAAERFKQLFPEDPKLIERDPTKDLANPLTGEVVTAGTPKAPEDYTLGPGQQRRSGANTLIAEVPFKPESPSNPTEASLAAAAAAGDASAREALRIMRAQNPPSAPRSPIWVVGKDGQFQDLAGVAPPGSKPANTREQGRAVVSGDANRIAELDTSLNDLTTLGKELGTTGAASKVGASLPNVVTEMTGWGMDAKSRQGTIDRVKQVIGKALEGGVLRKEDEYKYAKILPQIGDPPPVAASKLKGLKVAIEQRRQTTLDALADAGYDTSKFQQRAPAATADPLGIR